MVGADLNVKEFKTSERGSFTILSLFLFLGILIVCGMAVDLMMHEKHRVTVQNTADTAVLAASRMDAVGESREIVETYFEKAGLMPSLEDVLVEDTTNGRQVTVLTDAHMPTTFMSMIGYDHLPLETLSQARQAAVDIEISLVLDISSSMNRDSRLPELKGAVETFASDILPDDPFATASDVSINVVPYSLTVNPGEAIAQHFDIQGKHAYRDCVWFDNSDYLTTGMEPNIGVDAATAQTYERYTHMADGSGRVHDGVVTLPMCPDHTITPYLNEPGDVVAAVDALGGWDGTGIDIGAKWGLAMLDPTFQPVVDELILDGVVDSRMAGRPFEHGDSLKYLVIMSDGENDSQRDLHERMRSGASPFWRDLATGNISVLVRDGRDDADGSGGADVVTSALPTDDDDDDDDFEPGPFFSPITPPDFDFDDEDSIDGDIVDDDGDEPEFEEFETVRGWENVSRWYQKDTGDIADHPHTDGAGGGTDWALVNSQMVRLSWPEVFNMVKTTDLYEEYFEAADEAGYLTATESAEYIEPLDFNRVPEAETNQRLANICQLAAAQGVQVFAISFDPPSDLAQDTLRNCASEPANFFAVHGREISDAFAAISREVTELVLTQ